MNQRVRSKHVGYQHVFELKATRLKLGAIDQTKLSVLHHNWLLEKSSASA